MVCLICFFFIPLTSHVNSIDVHNAVVVLILTERDDHTHLFAGSVRRYFLEKYMYIICIPNLFSDGQSDIILIITRVICYMEKGLSMMSLIMASSINKVISQPGGDRCHIDVF